MKSLHLLAVAMIGGAVLLGWIGAGLATWFVEDDGAPSSPEGGAVAAGPVPAAVEAHVRDGELELVFPASWASSEASDELEAAFADLGDDVTTPAEAYDAILEDLVQLAREGRLTPEALPGPAAMESVRDLLEFMSANPLELARRLAGGGELLGCDLSGGGNVADRIGGPPTREDARLALEDEAVRRTLGQYCTADLVLAATALRRRCAANDELRRCAQRDRDAAWTDLMEALDAAGPYRHCRLLGDLFLKLERLSEPSGR